MKKTIHTKAPAYPNAASKAYYQQKALDLVTALVCTLGLTAALVYLVTFL